ncbi:MAG TPA: hypothetical protein DDZ21_03210, partial [Gammaproteobacteria bacterium]|nr:hypothetical protein [Gammaproteobacteria bacterium]
MSVISRCISASLAGCEPGGLKQIWEQKFICNTRLAQLVVASKARSGFCATAGLVLTSERIDSVPQSGSITVKAPSPSKAPALLLTIALISSSLTVIAQDSGAPRTQWGAPDLQGVYSIATVTMLERGEQFGGELVISAEEAARVGATGESYLDELVNSGDGEPDVGGYNTFWMDPGERMAEINGEIRSSIIVEPEDGRLPWAEGAQRTIFAGRRSRGAFDGPEVRPMGERCLVGFGSSGGPPM